MSKHYTVEFLRMLRNDVPIDKVIISFLNMEVRTRHQILRFRCPICGNFHTAVKHKTNLARCFDCRENFNPIDMVITVGKCSFVDAVELLKHSIDQ